MESIAEIWKDIQGYEGLYQVSNLGRVKSLGRNVKRPLTKIGYVWQPEKILKPNKTKYGYLKITLRKNNKSKYFTVHRLVAITFIPNPENKPQIDHINADKTNNSVNNLRWVTCKENINNPLTLIKNSGKNHYLYGKNLSEETKQNIRKAHLGKKISEETKEKLRGKNNPRSRSIKNLNTNEIFDSVRNAGKKYGVHHSSILYAIKHNGKCAGYHWEYV